MEKLVYTFWSDRPGAALAAALRDGLGGLPAVRGLQWNLPSPEFSGGQAPIRNLLPQFDGTVSVWLDSRRERAAVEASLDELCSGFHGYAVCESQPMTAQLPAPDADGHIDSLCQVCLLRKPAGMAYSDWLATWLDSHTEVAIERQGTVAYVQNIVQAAVTGGAPEIHGIVEECYPVAAYGDPGLFFGAAGDPAVMQANIEALMASTARFVATEDLDRIFTAPYSWIEAPAGGRSPAAAGQRGAPARHGTAHG